MKKSYFEQPVCTSSLTQMLFGTIYKMTIHIFRAALQTDRRVAEEREKNQQEEISALKHRIQELEDSGLYVRDDSKVLIALLFLGLIKSAHMFNCPIL